MKRFRAVALCAMVCCFLTLFAQMAFSQAGTADIVGTVTDSSGGVLPGATVTVKNLDTGLTRSQQTGGSGDYAFTLLPIGNYSIEVEASGFKMFSASRVVIATGDRARVDAPMQVGAVSQTVEVQAEQSAALQTDSSTVGGLITSQATQDLPLNGRNIIQLAQLTPGASEGPVNALTNGTRPDDRRQTSTIVANGQNFDTNNFMLDGLDNNERMVQTIIVKPSIDALQEVKTQTNLYTAESGRAAGAVVNMITRGGSNALHGTAFEFLRNDMFDAKNYFIPGKKPEYRQNQFGGSLGGAIKKDKLFFFGDYEGLRIVQGQVNPVGSGVIPTACELGKAICPDGLTQLGDFSDLLQPGTDCVAAPAQGCIYDPATTNAQFVANKLLNATATKNGGQPNWFTGNIIPAGRIDPISRAYLGLISPTYNGMSQAQINALCGNDQTVFTNARGGCTTHLALNKVQYFHTGDLRFDQHLSDKDSLYERYIINQVNGSYPGALPPVQVGNSLVYPGSSNGNAGSTSFPGTGYQRTQSVAVSETHIFRPNLLLQVNLQGSRYASISLMPDANVSVNSTVFPGPVGTNPAACGGGCGGLAPFSFGAPYSIIGDAFALPTNYFDTDYQATAALTWTHGPHTVKVGGSFIRRYFNVFNGVTKGNFGFSGTQTNSNAPGTGTGGNAVASMLLGVANTISQSFQLVPQEYRTNEIGLFAQDDWRATRKLTLNLGIRWDVFAPLTEKHNNLAVFDPLNPSILAAGTTLVAGRNGVSDTANFSAQLKDFQPRIGFAYTAGHGMVIRGGFGTTNYPDNTASPSILRTFPLSYNFSSAQPPVVAYPVTSVNIDSPLPTPTTFSNCVAAVCGQGAGNYQLTRGFISSGGTVTQNFKWPTIYQYNLIVEKEFAGNVVNIGYVGVLGRGAAAGINMNAVLPPNGPGGVSSLVGHLITQPNNADPLSKPCATWNSQRFAAGIDTTLVLTPNSAFPSATPSSCQPFFNQEPLVTSNTMYTPYGRSNYNALQAQFQRRYKNGLTFAANYTYAQALSNVGTGGGNCGSCGQVWNALGRDYGISDQDVRHRIAVTANYQLPFGKSLQGVEGQLVKGWQVNGIWVYSTGSPFTVTDGEGLLGNGAGGYRVNERTREPFTRSINEWFNTNDFVMQPFGTEAASNRNTFFGPNYTHTDLSLFKDFALTERFKLQFRAEVFNIFNHPYFSNPNSGITGWNTAKDAPSSLAPVCTGNTGNTACFPTSSHSSSAGSFGAINSTNPNYTPRDMQFALKLSF